MNDAELRNAMAEHGYEMTPVEIQAEKESIVRKIAPELIDTHGLSVEEAMQVIVGSIREQS